MGSARMACRFLKGSSQIKVDRSPLSPAVMSKIQRENTFLLYPSKDAVDISSIPKESAPSARFIILDGTWSTAKTMLREHPQLETLPKVSIRPTSPSLFRVRRQPKEYCLSSLEAAHAILQSFPLSPIQQRASDKMLQTFEWMNSNQLEQAKRKPLFCHWWPGRKVQFPLGAQT